MKERLVQLLDLEQLTPSKFADIIGVQRSSVSHVVSGRNNPSFDFIQKTLNAFPGLNADWLILGKGSMYEQMGRRGTGNLFGDRAAPEPGENTGQDDLQQPLQGQEVPEKSWKGDEPEPSENSGPLASDGSEGSLSGDPASQQEAPAGAATAVNGKPSPVHVAAAEKRITRVILLYDDDTFVSFDPS